VAGPRGSVTLRRRQSRRHSAPAATRGACTAAERRGKRPPRAARVAPGSYGRPGHPGVAPGQLRSPRTARGRPAAAMAAALPAPIPGHRPYIARACRSGRRMAEPMGGLQHAYPFSHDADAGPAGALRREDRPVMRDMSGLLNRRDHFRPGLRVTDREPGRRARPNPAPRTAMAADATPAAIEPPTSGDRGAPRRHGVQEATALRATAAARRTGRTRATGRRQRHGGAVRPRGRRPGGPARPASWSCRSRCRRSPAVAPGWPGPPYGPWPGPGSCPGS
jgi:hypothetical protein